jgi:hypothetical protein
MNRRERQMRTTVSVLLVTGLLLAAGSAAGQASEDLDGDGVADAVDQCPDTPAGDLVDGNGCSVCPCDAPAGGTAWASHRAYVACVLTAAKERRAAGRLAATGIRAAVRHARSSTCGNPLLTRCCIYATAADTVGRCRMMTADACDALDASGHVDSADDVDPGSCSPSPCPF